MTPQLADDGARRLLRAPSGAIGGAARRPAPSLEAIQDAVCEAFAHHARRAPVAQPRRPPRLAAPGRHVPRAREHRPHAPRHRRGASAGATTPPSCTPSSAPPIASRTDREAFDTVRAVDRAPAAGPVPTDRTDRLRAPSAPGCARAARNDRANPVACAHLHSPLRLLIVHLRGLHREGHDLEQPSCSPSCRPSPASPRRAAPSRRSPACSSTPPADGVELRATDMEVGLRVPLEAEVEREGMVVLPGAPAARRRPARCRGDVRARAAPDRAGRGGLGRRRDVPHPHAARRGLPAVSRAAGGRHRRRGAGAGVRRDDRKVARSASRDETRPILTGVLVGVSGTELRMVATDSYRLWVKETALESAVDPASRPTSRRARSRSSSGCAGDADEISVGVRANQVVFQVGGNVLSSRLIDGQFPNYSQLLPDAFEHELRIATRGAAVGRRAHQPHGAEERAAAAELRRGRADRVAPRRRTSARRRSRSPCRSPANRSRSGSTRSSSSDGLESRRGRRRRPQAHQPAAARA